MFRTPFTITFTDTFMKTFTNTIVKTLTDTPLRRLYVATTLLRTHGCELLQQRVNAFGKVVLVKVLVKVVVKVLLKALDKMFELSA